jgi:uncharacterized membrane protein
MPKITTEVPALILKEGDSITLYFDLHSTQSGKEKIKYAIHIINSPDTVSIKLADTTPISIEHL